LSFTIVPFYGWLPGMNGTVGVFGTNVKLDLTPIDLVHGKLLITVEKSAPR